VELGQEGLAGFEIEHLVLADAAVAGVGQRVADDRPAGGK
jgi:hypothetical protein